MSLVCYQSDDEKTLHWSHNHVCRAKLKKKVHRRSELVPKPHPSSLFIEQPWLWWQIAALCRSDNGYLTSGHLPDSGMIKCEANESICGSGWPSAVWRTPRPYVDAYCISLRRPMLSMESNNSNSTTRFNNICLKLNQRINN